MDGAAERNEGWGENCLGSGRGAVWGNLHPQQEGSPGTPVFHFTWVTEKLLPYAHLGTSGTLLGLTVLPQPGWSQRRYGSSHQRCFRSLSFASSSSGSPCMLHSSKDKITVTDHFPV